MKKRYFSIFLMVLLGLHMSSLDILGQSCSQLGLPENAVARLCRPDGGETMDLDYSPDGKTLASVLYWPRQIILWDVENRTEKLTINEVKGQSVKYSPDGKTLVCGDIVYDAITGEPKLLLFDAEGYRDFVVYSPDGKTLAGAGQEGIRFWDATTELTTDTSPEDAGTINVLPTDTSTILITTSDADPVVDPIATSSETVPGIRGLSYSPDGRELAIACALGIWVYDPELNEEVALLNREVDGHSDKVVSVVYSPDGHTMASIGIYGDSTIRIWDAKTKDHKFTFHRPKIPGGYFHDLSSLAFSPESNILISANRAGIDLWDPINGEYRYTLPGHEGSERTAIFSPDGNTIASAGQEQTILLWDFTSYPIVSISPDSVASLTAGEGLTFDLEITNGKNISGYQVTIEFDPDALAYQETEYGDYLSDELPVQPIVDNYSGSIQLASLSSSGINSNGDGTLATLKFKVNAIKGSKLTLRDVLLSNNEGSKSYAWIEGSLLLNSVIAEGCATFNIKDVNKDCIVNIQDLVFVASNLGSGWDNVADVNGDGIVDIIDLVLVAGAIGNTADAPAVYANMQEMFSVSNVQQWLTEARKVNLTDSTFQRGILILEQLRMVLFPKETVLLPNYPNPFNPETWIPYQLTESTQVSISIHAADGKLVRSLDLGNQSVGTYESRNHAAYWDGRNEIGEPVASGVYFYTLTAGDFAATRKMLVRK